MSIYSPIANAYSKIDDFRDKEFEKRVQEAVSSGQYPSLEEAAQHVSQPNVFSVVKSIVVNQSSAANTPLELRVLAMKYIVENIMEINAETFSKMWSIKFLKDHNLYTHVYKIIKDAPSDVVERCGINPKLIFLSMVWPDEKELVDEDDISQLFYATNDRVTEKIKYLRSEGRADKAFEGKTVKHGALVDKNIMDALEGVMYSKREDLSTDDEVFSWLAAWDKNPAIRRKHAAIFSVIESRGYTSFLDFYFLNQPSEVQRSVRDTYLKYREVANLPRVSYIDSYVKASIFTELYPYASKRKIAELYERKYPAIERGDISRVDALNLARKEELTERYEAANEDFEKLIARLKKEASKISLDSPKSSDRYKVELEEDLARLELAKKRVERITRRLSKNLGHNPEFKDIAEAMKLSTEGLEDLLLEIEEDLPRIKTAVETIRAKAEAKAKKAEAKAEAESEAEPELEIATA